MDTLGPGESVATRDNHVIYARESLRGFFVAAQQRRMPGRNAIPVRGPGGPSRAQGRDTAVNQPWRSSLDLVWSYSRSQAYFGDNITTSPSFVERHWRGRVPEGQGDIESDATPLTSADSATEDETSADNIESSDDESAALHARVRDRGATSLETQKYWHTLEPEGDFEHTETVRGRPGYADRNHNARAFVKRPTSNRSHHSGRRAENEYDEGLSDGDEGEDSSRSRSRSPKRLGGETPTGQRLLMPYGKDRAPSRPPRDSSPYGARKRSRSQYRTQLRAAAPHLRDPYHVDERAPLLRGRTAQPAYSTSSRGASPPAEQDAEHGKSTFWQTWFNAVNVLVGVSILSMPLAFACAGWVGGTLLFFTCGWLTNYSGKVLAGILAHQPHLHTYADIGSFTFGPMMRTYISFLFCFEMWMVSVALLILMGDSMTALIYGADEQGHAMANMLLKIAGTVVVLPTLFLPLKLLSPISLVGIVSILFLIVVIVTDGLYKAHAPGSLWEPSATIAMPNWPKLPLAFGLMMAGFSSHPVIPSLYRDMRDPTQFNRMLDLAYLTTAAMYLLVAVVGYLMFGGAVSDEVTRDLATTLGFPYLMTFAAVLLMTINPMTKFALALRPVNSMLEKYFGVLDGVALPATPSPAADDEGHQSLIQSMSGVQAMAERDMDGTIAKTRAAHPALLAGAIRVAMAATVLFTAIVVPSLERIMGFLGAFLTFNSCIFGPLLANMVLNRTEMPQWLLMRDLFILAATFVLAVMGTLSSLIPTV